MFIHKFVAFIVISCLGVAYGSFAWGTVLWQLWSMNVLSIFSSAPPLNQTQAIGIALTFSIFKDHSLYLEKDEETTSERLLKLFASLLLPWITLAVGAVIHLLSL